MWTDWVTEFLVMAAILMTIDMGLQLKIGSRPWMPFFFTTILGGFTLSHLAQQTWDLSQESLEQPCDDDFERHLIVFAAAYMVGNLPVQFFFSRSTKMERFLYVIHHLSAFNTLFCAIYYDMYGRFTFFFIAAEASNLFLNGRDLVPPESLLRKIFDFALAFSFLGLRMGYLYPVLVRTLFFLATEGRYFELFVMHWGTFIIGLLHLWWTFLILSEIVKLFLPRSTPITTKKQD